MRCLVDELNAVTKLWRADEPEVNRDDHWKSWDLVKFVDYVVIEHNIEISGHELFTEEIAKRFTEDQLQEMYLKWQLEKE